MEVVTLRNKVSEEMAGCLMTPIRSDVIVLLYISFGAFWMVVTFDVRLADYIGWPLVSMGQRKYRFDGRHSAKSPQQNHSNTASRGYAPIQFWPKQRRIVSYQKSCTQSSKKTTNSIHSVTTQ